MRRILIVDDSVVNRRLLRATLGREYEILEAADGQEALATLTDQAESVSAVLLDLRMPVMDGYAVLTHMREHGVLTQIPVIVITGSEEEDARLKALALGANDFVMKPYNPEILKHCLVNNIALRETASMVQAIQRDKLTGLYSREVFFQQAAELIQTRPAGYFLLACFDIDNFKLYNDQFGAAEGDKILRYIGAALDRCLVQEECLCGRISGDNFAALYPNRPDVVAAMAQIRETQLLPPHGQGNLRLSVGRCLVNDPTLPVIAIYDRAYMAKQSIKGRYDQHTAYFNAEMLAALIREQEISGEMDKALAEGQFRVWFQPQYNHASAALIGAEALVRWQHPQKGLIPPGAFIPIFEQNGFIYALDRYVWEQTCLCLRKWLDEGRRPLPVSVNVSRYDVFRGDFPAVLTDLVRKYQIPVELLRLEITESAFTESTQQIVRIVQQLVDYGFTVEIDDFGSGYSSLNTLKSVPAQVVKLDMRFLENDNDTQRGGSILEAIVRMTKWLGMSVIAEGVEEQAQADFLKSIGCNYIQGYLYSKPLPVDEYQRLAQASGKEEHLLALETVENLDNNRFWEPRSMDTLIFNSYVGAACIFEYHNNEVELLRTNDKFAAILGAHIQGADTLGEQWQAHLTEDSRAFIRRAIDRSIANKQEVSGEYTLENLPGQPGKTYLRCTMRVIAAAGSRYLVYSACENITAQRLAEKKERQVSQQLQTLLDHVNCGITAVALAGEQLEYLLTNDRYYQLLGYTREEYQALVTDPYLTIHEQDRQRVAQASRHNAESGQPLTIEYRVLRRDGSVAWLRSDLSMTRFTGVEQPVQLCIFTDVTAEKLAAQELLDNLPSGAAMFEFSDDTLTISYLNNRYWELLGRSAYEYGQGSPLNAVYPADRELVLAEIRTAIKEKRDASFTVRLLCGGEQYKPFAIALHIVARSASKYALYASFTPVLADALAYQEMLPIALRAMMASQTDFSFVKDKQLRYVCCSRAVVKLLGLADESEIRGKTDRELFPPELAKKYIADDQALMASGESLIDVTEIIPANDGIVHYATTSKYLLHDAFGAVVGIYGQSRDITEAQETLSQLQLLNDTIPGGLATYACSPQGISVLYYNEGFCRLFGSSRKTYQREKALDPMSWVYEEDKPAVLAQAEALLREGKPMQCIYRSQVKGGGYKWIAQKTVVTARHGDTVIVGAVLLDVTEQQEAAERLRISEEENRLSLSHSGDTVCRYNVAERSVTLPPELNPIFALPISIENVPYGQVEQGEISPDTAQAYIAFYESIFRGEKTCAVTYQRKSALGWRWLHSRATTIFANNGEPVSAVLSITDISEQIEKEAMFKKWQQSLEEKSQHDYALFRCNLSQNGVIDSQRGGLLEKDFLDSEKHFSARTAEYVRRFVHAEDKLRYAAVMNAEALLTDYYRGKRGETLEYREMVADDGFRWLRLTIELVQYTNSKDVEAYILFENIDDSKRAELLTIERAETDPLTGVLNRATFAAQVTERIQNGQPHTQHALLMLDVDGFKLVNDVFGHSAGDETLIDLVAVLQGLLRHDDLLGRLGGDEFVIFLSDIAEDAIASKARQICSLSRKSFSLEVQISASIGIAVSPQDGDSFESLYKNADSALYYVKGSGKNGFAFYRPDMATTPAPAAEEFKPIDRHKGQRKRRMLIVDDNKSDYELLSHLFRDDFLIEKAKDGNSALIRLRHYGSAIDLVLLDLMMPGMDGYAVLDRMQSSAELQAIPVIVVSGDDVRETSLKAIRHGATDFVTKPVDSELLIIRVKSAIARAENERLRAQNSFLELQNNEANRYRTVLERTGTVIVEQNWISGEFQYSPAVENFIAGSFDNRKLWRILLSDLVTDVQTVRRMQEFVHQIAEDRERRDDSMVVWLKTPAQQRHRFRLNVYKQVNEYQLTEKLLLAFTDLERFKNS